MSDDTEPPYEDPYDEPDSPEEVEQHESDQKRISLGAEAKRFATTPLYLAIQEQALADIDQALEEFAKVDITNIKAVADLQVRVRTANGVISYVKILIAEGESASKKLNSQTDEEDNSHG